MSSVSDAQYPASWREHDDKIRPYRRAHRWVRWSKNAVALSLLVVWIGGGLGTALEARLQDNGLSGWLSYFALLSLYFGVSSLPFSVLSQSIERKYALSRQTWSDWWLDQAKGLGVGAVLGLIVISILYFTVQHAGAQWWLWSATAFVLLSVVLAQLAPVILLPIFIRLDPLPEGEVRRRVFALCEKHRVVVAEIYQLGLGAKTEKGNAAFMGLGRTKRIAIGDTILEKYPTEEVEAVFAHELGHQVHLDIWRGLALSTFLLFATFAISATIATEWWYPWLGLGETTPTAIVAYFVLLGIVQLPADVLQAAHSRSRERAADRFASQQEGLALPLAGALERLTFQNWGQFRPHPWLEFLTYSHPAPHWRITSLRQG